VCLVTHVLLPARLLLRRVDEAPVIGAACRREGRRDAAEPFSGDAVPVLSGLWWR
jgi:hypothetical protein